MKRAIALIAAVLLLFSAIQLPAYASAKTKQGDVTISVDEVIAEAGSDTIVSVNVSGQYEANVLHLFVDYDSELLHLNGDLTPGAVWSAIEGNNGYVSVNTSQAGRIGFIALQPQGTFSGNGAVFSMTFHVSADAAAGTVIPLNITVEQFSNDELDGTSNAIQFTAENGSVTVPLPHPMEASISANTAEAEPGAEVEIEIAVTGDYQANILNFTVEYDASILSLISDPAPGAIWNAFTENGGYALTNTAVEGEVGFIGLLPEGCIEGDGNVFSLSFRVADDAEIGTVVPVTVTILQFSYDDIDGTSNDVDCTVENGSVIVIAPAVETYTITWIIDGVEETETYEFGTMPTHEDPVKEGYTFIGWTPEIDVVTGNATYTAVFEENAPAGYHIYVTDYTKGIATAGIDPEMLYNGEVTFTVTCDVACAVGIDNGNDSYTRLTCSTVNGEHTFKVTVTDADVYLVLVVRGDVTFDGRVRALDATRVNQAAVGNSTLTALQIFAADLNRDGIIKAIDATKVKQVAVGNQTYTW